MLYSSGSYYIVGTCAEVPLALSAVNALDLKSECEHRNLSVATSRSHRHEIMKVLFLMTSLGKKLYLPMFQQEWISSTICSSPSQGNEAKLWSLNLHI